jgi:hypothetical protein
MFCAYGFDREKPPWTVEDAERLRQHTERGGSRARAAIMFKRSEQAVRAHAATLCLKFPTIRELRKKATGSERRSFDS